ncbi:WD40-like Beta Propeller Repeat [Dyadobacter koreensis]|uniref:WD40-like Beta Propeller Repeat n=2 Tax=Dyadobacter koreensis TaxID=408657 RepID=A0A1H6S484_9BACT|nr:WD40-like Beta Propeller Repeat [Dyadobacter koreensis]
MTKASAPRMSLVRRKLFICSSLILLVCGKMLAQQPVLWADKILGYSSEYRPESYGQGFRSKQILGEPNKLPDFGVSPCAWSPATPDGRNEEWIKVGFEKSIALKQVAIAENYNPGSVTRVYAYNEAGKEFLIYDEKAGPVSAKGRMLRVFTKQENLIANAIKIILDPSKVGGFNQIDAIGISSTSDPIEAVINVADSGLKEEKKENLGKAINSKGQEINPIISADGRTLYFTRAEHEGNIGSPSKQDAWVSTLDKNNNWTEAVNLGPPVNNNGDNAIIGVSADGKNLYLINVYLPGGGLVYGLSKSTNTKNGWSFPKAIKIENLYNDHDFSEFAISPHGNVLIMSVQRKDTEGKKDLYVSFIQEGETWSEPKHMGTVLNSASDENSPFLALDNKTLYFTSSGRSGYGGGDVFLSRRLDDTWLNWSKPENLGPNINTPKHDSYFNIPASGEYGYFSSADNTIGREDIFRIRLTPAIKPDPVATVTGSVFEFETTNPVKAVLSAKILKTGETFSKTTFEGEAGEFKLILPLKESYIITADEKGYFSSTEEIDLVSETGFRTIRKNLYLQPIKPGQQIRLANNMFSQSSADITEPSFQELDRIIGIMNEYPEMEILLEGHTDNQGDTKKNVKLSEDRVVEVKKYLVTKGIGAFRIQTKAWGPAKPIASNLTEATRQKNRRVEFTILKM